MKSGEGDLLSPFEEGTLVSDEGEGMAEERQDVWERRWLERSVF